MKSKEKEEEESRARALEEAEAIEAVIEEARVKALETMAKGVSMEDGSYEGGTALAPCCTHGSVSLDASEAQAWASAVEPQSVHVSLAKLGPSNSLYVEHQARETSEPLECAAPFEMTAAALVPSGAKNDAECLMSGMSLGECGPLLVKKLLEVLPLRSQTLGRGSEKTLFPLPTSRESLSTILAGFNSSEVVWVQCVVLGLNSMWGAEVTNQRKANQVQSRCIQSIGMEVRRFCHIDCKIPSFSWKEFFRVKSIDYKGTRSGWHASLSGRTLLLVYLGRSAMCPLKTFVP